MRLQKKRYREKALKRKQSLNEVNKTTAPVKTAIKPATVKNPVKNEDKAKEDKRKKWEEFAKK